MCAAPGSKTMQLLEMLHINGFEKIGETINENKFENLPSIF